MMKTWGLNLINAEDTGVMNSLFGGEAYAIGGYGLMMASPIILAFNLFLSYFMIKYVLVKFVKLTNAGGSLLSLFVVSSIVSLSSDFAGFLFLKYPIMVMLFFMPLVILCRLPRIRFR